MKPDEIINSILQLLGESLDGVKVTAAYPETQKPTRLAAPYIAVGIKEINLSPAFIDSSVQEGDICVFINIFVPLKSETSPGELFSLACAALDGEYDVAAIGSGKTVYDRDAEAKTLDAFVTVRGITDFGGEADE